MGDGIQRIIERQRAAGFPAFRGASVSGTIPVSEAVLNAVAWAALSEQETPVQRMRLTLPGGNRIVVDLVARILIVNKAFRLELEVDEVVDFAREPVLRLRFVGAGLTGVLIEIFSSLFRQEGIRITGGAILVDLREILERQNFGFLLPLIRWVQIRGQAGQLNAEFLLMVPDEGTGGK
jgi:hypothetical protein